MLLFQNDCRVNENAETSRNVNDSVTVPHSTVSMANSHSSSVLYAPVSRLNIVLVPSPFFMQHSSAAVCLVSSACLLLQPFAAVLAD